MILIVYALIALGWYESFFWGIAILQRTTRPIWRLPRHAFALMVGPVVPVVAVVRRIGVSRGLVAKGLLLLAGLSSIVWIGAWVAVLQFFWLDTFVAEYVTADQGWFTFMSRDQRWIALLSWLMQPWFRLTWKAVLFIDTGIMMLLLWVLADSWVKMKVDSDAVRALVPVWSAQTQRDAAAVPVSRESAGRGGRE